LEPLTNMLFQKGRRLTEAYIGQRDMLNVGILQEIIGTRGAL
jgi:hypothetical protein